MTPEQIKLVQTSWAILKPNAKDVAASFYRNLFLLDSSLKPMFSDDIAAQGKKLTAMLTRSVSLLNNVDSLVPEVQKLGIRHLDYQVKPEHYETVGEALITTLSEGLGDKFTDDVRAAWTEVYGLLASTMLNASNNVKPTTKKTVTRRRKTATKEIKETSDMNDSTSNMNSLAIQLKGALDQSASAVMMIDRDFIITYYNASTLKLLSKHEAVFKTVWPNFSASADYLEGLCIDVFHKHPEHQRKMLSDPRNLPYTTDIHIAHLTIELNVSAIFDDKNEYVGNSLEWSDVTTVRETAREVARLMSAVDGMTTNLMMADTKGNILYLNNAVTKMLRRREQQLRSVLPSFSVDSLVGSNFDTFHKNPAHQQALLSNPDNLPYNANIAVAGLEFNLQAMALRDDKGNHIGNAVQWLDITEEKDAQRQVDGLIEAAIGGKLTERINTAEYQGFMKDLGEKINALMDAVILPINSAIEVTQALAKGDLTKQMEGDYSGSFLELSEAMNSSIGNLNSLVTEISNASNNVFESAREIAEGNMDLSQRTESQASSLEETASAMEELSSTVQQNAENSEQASKLSKEVIEKASNGGKVVENAIDAMSEINKSSKEIADIISVIDEIAFQTNLLALNAAVEAARAGEQGRGFAVVAAEVRNLAQRSAGAAKEIKGLINDSVDAVGKGTKLVDETGQTFEQLVKAIDEMGVMIADISSAGKEQAAGIGEVSSAVTQMDEMTQQNAALVEEAAASSKSMEEQAQLLLEQIAFFNGEEPAQPETALRPIAQSRMPDRNRRTTAMATKKPAKLMSPSESDDEWEEF